MNRQMIVVSVAAVALFAVALVGALVFTGGDSGKGHTMPGGQTMTGMMGGDTTMGTGMTMPGGSTMTGPMPGMTSP